VIRMASNVPQPIKILMINLSWPSEIFLHRLFCGLPEAGMEVTIASSRKPDRGQLAHHNLHWLPIPALNGPLWGRWISLAKSLVWALSRYPGKSLRLARQVKQPKGGVGRLITWFNLLPLTGKSWDIIYFPWNSTAIGYLPLFGSEAGLISFLGSLINIVATDPSHKEILEQLGATLEKAAVVHCDPLADKIEALQYGLDPAKAWVIRPAVDPDFFCPPTQPIIHDSTFRIVTVAPLLWQKGYEYALLAVRRLLDQGISVQFHIIGDGPERSRLLYTIGDLELQGQVHLHGRLSPEGVRSQLQQADVFLLASLSEGISTAALEAMACGLPVVTTDCRGMREVVTDGAEGLVVLGRDPKAIAVALSHLAADPGKCQKMGKRGRAQILEHFTNEQQVQELFKMYQAGLLQ
jgi:colanic acid/amylovoran biosynthesis glycosyltransferase